MSLDAGLLAQLAALQPLRLPLVASQRRFALKQKRRPSGVADIRGVAAGFDAGEGLGHAVQAELMELVGVGAGSSNRPQVCLTGSTAHGLFRSRRQYSVPSQVQINSFKSRIEFEHITFRL
jgi:hypothetical protein